MKEIIKKIIPFLPRFLRVFLFKIYELFGSLKVKRFYKYKNTKKDRSEIKNILFYHPTGLSFGGTEKFLQILAKYIDDEKYNLFFMYSSENEDRKYYFEKKNIELIPFDYSIREKTYPYLIKGMHPSIFDVTKKEDIDLIIIPGSGYTEFPINIIKDIPIIMLNIFGSPTVQKNIVKHFCISNAVAEKIRNVVDEEKVEIMYIPSEKPEINEEKIKKIKEKFDIKDSDIVFGRIGRASDEIYDSIGIEAFKKLVSERNDVHYIIMSPPPILVKKVSKENIPNVHFIDSSSNESDVWVFHNSIDILAHFRNDGESCGLNIIESMLCGNLIATHKSHIWNAHLEYLKPEFSRISKKDDVEGYYINLKELIDILKNSDYENIKNDLIKYSKEKFLIANEIKRFEKIIDQI